LVVYLPLWKIWKSVGTIIPNIYIYGKIKLFQTTNQLTVIWFNGPGFHANLCFTQHRLSWFHADWQSPSKFGEFHLNGQKNGGFPIYIYLCMIFCLEHLNIKLIICFRRKPLHDMGKNSHGIYEAKWLRCFCDWKCHLVMLSRTPTNLQLIKVATYDIYGIIWYFIWFVKRLEMCPLNFETNSLVWSKGNWKTCSNWASAAKKY
jgi:hypothetical protein